MMKVLLISPLNPKISGNLKFLSGESTYTETLLGNPPDNVRYTFFEDALKKGDIEYTFWQMPLNLLIKFRILPLSPRIICIRVKKNFDLIHTHGHPLKISGKHPSVILSDSSGNYQFLKGYLGWSSLRIAIGYFLKRLTYRFLGIYDQEVNFKETKLIVWSEFTKKVHQTLGADAKKMIVIPPGIAKLPKSKKTNIKRFNILFIGTWFIRKGGLVLLEAFDSLSKKYPHIFAYIIGEIPQGINLPVNTYHKNYIPREKLLNEIFPNADVLVLVPPKAEGYGLTPLEAGSLGIPSIVSSIYALPEIVDNNKTGLVIPPNDHLELAKALEKLIINPDLRRKLGNNARKKFLEKYWIQKTNKKLLEVYYSSL